MLPIVQNLASIVLLLIELFFTVPLFAAEANQEIFFTVPALVDEANQDGEILGMPPVSTNDPSFKTTQSKAVGGDVKSQYQLGFLYLIISQTSPAESAMAIKWLKIAAAQSNAPAECMLGSLSTNRVDAVKWYQKAAQQDDMMACVRLGEMSQNGQGTSKDLVQAYKWYTVANMIGHGDPEDFKERKTIAANMTTNQIAEALHQAATFVPSKQDSFY